MAKKEQKPKLNYSEQLKKLRTEGPQRVYLLHGEEDYLRDSFLEELKKNCVDDGTDTFNLRVMRWSTPDIPALREALESMPFMAERTLTVVRDFDINKTSAYDPDALKSLVSDVPEWATLAFVFSPGYALDNRLGVIKALKKVGADLEFSRAGDAELVRWVMRRIEGLGKRIDGSTANYLIWICGTRMNELIPEMVKIAGAASGTEITRADSDAVAKKAPETVIFDLTDALGAKEYDKAASLLADLLADKDEPPQKQIYMVSEQFRRLFAARTALDNKLPDSYITDCIPELEGRSYPLSLLKKTCRNYSRKRLAHSVRLCARCDYAMKSSSGVDENDLMKELLLRLAMEKS